MKLDFLTEPSLKAAPKLLGVLLCRQTPAGTIKLKIVETEAYHQADPASHSYRGITPRTAPMFDSGGTIYVYFTYGMHYCLNIVAGQKGVGEGVLIRAGEPVEGVDIMKANRGLNDIKNLANGPGKLTQALGIKDTKLSGQKLGPKTLWLEPANNRPKVEVTTGPRIGIREAVEQPWRFYIKDNPFISRP